MRPIALIASAAISTGFGTTFDDHWPPEQWRGVGTTLVTFVRSQAEIDRLCGKAPKGLTTEACTMEGGVVVLPDPCTYPGEFARIGCHENAHRFTGWPKDHPQ